jgi:monothiol glutaredoxin
MVCRILDAYGVDYGSRNVLADPAIRDGIKAFTGWPTIPQVKGGERVSQPPCPRAPPPPTSRPAPSPPPSPTQVFAKAEFLGGADILMAMHNAGELEAALTGVEKEGGEGGDGHVHGPGCKH